MQVKKWGAVALATMVATSVAYADGDALSADDASLTPQTLASAENVGSVPTVATSSSMNQLASNTDMNGGGTSNQNTSSSSTDSSTTSSTNAASADDMNADTATGDDDY